MTRLITIVLHAVIVRESLTLAIDIVKRGEQRIVYFEVVNTI